MSVQVNIPVPSAYPLSRNGTRCARVFSFLIEKGLLHNRIKGKAERQAAASRVPPVRVVGHVARQAGLPTPCPQWWISAFREDNLPWHA